MPSSPVELEGIFLRTCAPISALWVFGIMEFLAQTPLSLLLGPVWISSLGYMHTRPLTVPAKPGMGGEGSGQ